MKRNIIIHILKRWILFLCFHVVRTDIVGRLKISDVANVKSSMVDKNLVVCVGVIEDIPNSVTVYTCTAALFSNKADENPTVGLSFNAEQIFSHIIIFDGESWEKVNAIGGATDIAPKLFVEDVLDYVMMPFLFPDEEVHPVHTIGGIKFNVALSCMKNRFGQRCLQYCNVEESGEKYFCHPITGEMICRSGWLGKDCSEKVQDVDSQFFKTRPKRSEGERIDCLRRRCSPREMLRQFLTAPVFNRGVEMDFREPENITICSEEACDPIGMQMCLIDEGRPVCRCKPGYFGDRCSETDKCYLELCKNGAVCEKLEEGGSICNCPDGFEGEYCEEQTDLCLLEPCGPLGECVSDVRGFLCHCAVGLTGERCEIDINDCLNDSCSGRGKCHDGINSYDCVCDEGYGGKSCEIELNGCSGDPCQNGARCASYGDGYYECDCLEGYEGATCSEEIEDPCSTNPCNGNGNCYAKIVEEGEEFDHLYKRVAHCSCDEGYSGEYCETVVSFCDEEDAYCPSNATCVNLKEEYTCVCPPGYEGEFCEKECDECQEQSELRCEENPCKNGARCVAIGEHVQCICGKGYYGSKCEKYVDYCIESPCESGICQSTRDGFECLCDEGFTGDLCGEDVNECEIQTNLCKHGGECVNFYGGYECNCLKGYVGE